MRSIMSFLRSLPSRGQFRLLKYGVILALLAPLTAVWLLIKTGTYASDYAGFIRDSGRLMREGKITAVPLAGGPPHFVDFRKAWSCRLRLPSGGTVDYLRKEKPDGRTHLYFFEHPDITGTIENPRLKFEPGEPTRDVVVEVSEHPDWHETFTALARGSLEWKTTWLAVLALLTALSVWFAWKSYWMMKGGRRRRHKR
jgi:hypothetical protein